MFRLFYLLIVLVSINATSVTFDEELGEVVKFEKEIGEIVKFEQEIGDIFRPGYLAEILAHGKPSQCQIDFAKVLVDAGIFHKGYALKLLDATAKIPDGLLLGNHYFMGQYYECLGVEHPKGRFYGKYCNLGILTSSGDDPIGAAGISYTFGFCAPSSCSAAEINTGFQKINKTVILMTNDGACYTAHDDERLNDLDKFAISVIIILCVLACISTIYEVYQRMHFNNAKPNPLYSSFSIYQNGKALFEVRNTGDGQMDCLHGIRAMSMLWVILCHVALVSVSASNNSLEALAASRQTDYIVISNGYLSVDTFFFLSGLLVTFVFFRDIGKSGSYDVPRTYISRYIRLTPPYAMIVFLQVTIINSFGSGPIWKPFLNTFTDSCRRNWWTGLLYVQNIVNPDDQCLIQTWYLSADMQMYWIAPLFLYPLYLWPIVGAILLAVITVAAAFWSFGINIIYDLSYSPFFDTSGYENSMDNYVPWTRVSPWLVGVLLGFAICGLKAKKIEVNLKPIYILCGWLLSLTLLASCMFGMIWFLENPDDVTLMESAAFLAFHRTGWALGLGILVFLCIHGYGGPINTFLSWNFFQILGKMSYCVYLVHISAILVVVASLTTTLHSNFESILFIFIAVTIYSHLAAIPLSLLVEMPFSNLDKIYFRSVKIFPYPKGKPAEKTHRLLQAGQLPTVVEAKEVEEGRLHGESTKQQ